MIWQCTEILAVIVECMIVTRMMIQYFNFLVDRNCIFRHFFKRKHI